MALDTLTKIAAAMLTAQNFPLNKPTVGIANAYVSLWKSGSFPLPATANPPASTAGAGYVPDKTTLGAINFTNPSVGNETRVGLFDVQSTVVGALYVYDRLWHCSGFNGTSVLEQLVTTPGALTRPDANGAGVEAWIETYVATGATAVNVTLKYTNQDGVANQTAVTSMPASMAANRVLRLNLASGDTGVRQVTSVTLSATTGTAGNFGVTLRRPLPLIAGFPVATANQKFDAFACGLAKVPNDACLDFVLTGLGTPNLLGNIALIQG